MKADGGHGGPGGNVLVQADARLRSSPGIPFGRHLWGQVQDGYDSMCDAANLCRIVKLPERTRQLDARRGGPGSSHMTQGSVGHNKVIKVGTHAHSALGIIVGTSGNGQHQSSHSSPSSMQVPPGTSVWLLDKVFARVPELKSQYKDKEQEGGQHGKEEPPVIDTHVSSDYGDLHERFAPFRALQKAQGRRGVVTLDALAKAQSPSEITQARQYVRNPGFLALRHSTCVTPRALKVRQAKMGGAVCGCGYGVAIAQFLLPSLIFET